MFKNKFAYLIQNIFIFGAIIISGVLFYNSVDLNITNNLKLDDKSLLATIGGTFDPPDDGKPDPNNTAGYS